jgi:hypothetical protein
LRIADSAMRASSAVQQMLDAYWPSGAGRNTPARDFANKFLLAMFPAGLREHRGSFPNSWK